MSLRPASWRPVALVAGVAVGAYAAGVLTGAARPVEPPASTAAPVATTASVLDAAAARIAEQAAHPVDPQVLERAAVEGMLRALGDRWSQYYSPTEATSFRQAVEGRYTGVGLWLRPTTTDTSNDVMVASVQQGSSAASAGILAGDDVLAVDGQDVSREPVGVVASLLRGVAGTRVAVTIGRDGARRTMNVTRSDLARGDVTVARLRGGIDVLRIAAFSRGVGREVRAALASDVGTRTGVVLDLRGNPGGLVTEAVEVASCFLVGGTVVSYDKRGEPTHTLAAIGNGDAAVPLVVLVDGGTASAAEITAAALQDRNRAVIVGSRTYGKGSVQEPSTLPDGSAIELTVGRYRTPSGRTIDEVGVEPDVAVNVGASPDQAERRALEVLRGLVAASGSRG
jgi:carboxyl-terminal processing protease